MNYLNSLLAGHGREIIKERVNIFALRPPMSCIITRTISIVLLFILLSDCSGGYHAASNRDSLWVREELYFGADIPTGGVVTDSLWEDFVNREVLSRFPDGFTTLPAMGRYKYKTGEIKKEPTRIVIIYCSPHGLENAGKVEEIIELYKKRFSQESVLRVRSRMETKF
jgi:hypothetical protein